MAESSGLEQVEKVRKATFNEFWAAFVFGLRGFPGRD